MHRCALVIFISYSALFVIVFGNQIDRMIGASNMSETNASFVGESLLPNDMMHSSSCSASSDRGTNIN